MADAPLELLEALVPQVKQIAGVKFADSQIVDELRAANYDTDKTVISLLEKSKTMGVGDSRTLGCVAGWRSPPWLADDVQCLQVGRCRCRSQCPSWRLSHSPSDRRLQVPAAMQAAV
jgi:hypothetical protein